VQFFFYQTQKEIITKKLKKETGIAAKVFQCDITVTEYTLTEKWKLETRSTVKFV